MLKHVEVQTASTLPDLSHTKRLVLDYETDSGNPKRAEADPWFGARIAMIGVSDGETIWTVGTDRCLRGRFRLPWENVELWLRDTISAPRERYVAQWIRAEAHLSRAAGCPLRRDAMWYCTEIASHHLQDTLLQNNLTFLAKHLCNNIEVERWEGILNLWLRDAGLHTGQKPGNFAEVPTELLSQYLASDVFATHQLEMHYEPLFDDRQREALYQDFQVNKILCDMQYRGVRVNVPKLQQAQFVLMHNLQTLSDALVAEIGHEFNPMSSTQLAELLINTYHLPVLRWTDDTDKNRPSFDDDTLRLYLELPPLQPGGDLPQLRGIIEKIDQYRDKKKLLGFVEQYLELQRDGQLHSSVHPCRARGGRTTAAHPNMQQVPDLGKLFIEPAPGCALYDVDASQIEYRWMAHYMKDERLLEGYKSRDFDIHKYVQEWLGIPRRPAKVINFGVAFNMGAEKLSREYAAVLGGKVSLEEAKQILNRYFNELVTNLKPTRRDVAGVAERRGYVINFFGRHSHLERVNSYKGFNRVVQGSAADMVKNRMVAVDTSLREVHLENDVFFDLMIHDELIFDVPLTPEITRIALPLIHRTLEGFSRARCPIYWDGCFSPGNWFDAAKVKEDKKSAPVDYYGVPIRAAVPLP